MDEASVKFIIYLLIITVSSYYLIPELLCHILGIGAQKRHFSPGTALTFDDGPDPKYTPLLLEILKKHNIKACFFLLGSKAKKHPELVQAIIADGHDIGSHGHIHKHAWFLSPSATWKLWNLSISTLKDITGKEPRFVRPPWGGVNLSFLLWCLVKRKKIILWSVSGKDWNGDIPQSLIVKKVVHNAKEGSIILLHDSGGKNNAPANTIACVEELCRKIKEENKIPITALNFPRWSLLKRISFRLWEKWEHLYARLNKIKKIDENNLFRLSLSRYKGPDLKNDKGELLAKKGDMIGEIHFDNARFQTIGNNLARIGVQALKQVRLSLPALARYISDNPDYKDINVYIGITLLNRGAKGLGFNVQDYPCYRGPFIGFWQKLIVRIYHPLGKKRNTSSLGKSPKIVWISKETLINRYIKENKKINKVLI